MTRHPKRSRVCTVFKESLKLVYETYLLCNVRSYIHFETIGEGKDFLEDQKRFIESRRSQCPAGMFPECN